MEEDFRTLLLTGGGSPPPLAGLVGTRVYWNERPQATALPSVTLTRITGIPQYEMSAVSGLVMSRVQVDCWGQTYAAAKGVARAIKAAASGFRGTAGGTVFQGAFVDAERDMELEPTIDNAAERFHRVSLDFLIWHDE